MTDDQKAIAINLVNEGFPIRSAKATGWTWKRALSKEEIEVVEMLARQPLHELRICSDSRTTRDGTTATTYNDDGSVKSQSFDPSYTYADFRQSMFGDD